MENQEIVDEQRTNMVVKGNELIQKASFSLTVTEQKFIAYIISLIKPEDRELQFYTIKVTDFAQLCGISPNNVYKDFMEMAVSLTSKKVRMNFKDGKNEVHAPFSWLSEAEYISNGTVRVLLNSRMKKSLLDLISRGDYTQYELFNILWLKSKYSIRLYEILKSYVFKGSVSYEIGELKTMLVAESYKSFTQLKTRVLDKAISEMNKFTDLDIKCTLIDENGKKTEVAQGKKVHAVKFRIKQKDEQGRYLAYRKTIEEINRRNKQIKGQLEFDEFGNISEY